MKRLGIPSWKIVDHDSNATSYNKYNYQWNKVFDVVFPVAFFIPSSVCDVQATVKCGWAARIQLVPNSGGHSYAGLSLGTNHSIVVDFRYMNSIDINDEDESFTVGPGALVGPINAKLWRNGGWGIALGNCMTVAIGGHGIGGGYGIYSTLYGLVIDNLLEIEMVDAQGNAVTVNPNRNSDLWWAMRGVGPGYIGLVTSYKLKMFKAKNLKLTHVRVAYKNKDLPLVVEQYTKWLDWAKRNNESVNAIVSATSDNHSAGFEFTGSGVEVHLVHIQDPDIQPTSSEAVLNAYPKYFTNSTRTEVQTASYIDVLIATSYTPIAPSKTLSVADGTFENIREKKLDFFLSLTKEMATITYSYTKSYFVDKKFRAKDLIDAQKVFAKITPNPIVWFTSEQGAVAAPRSTDCAYVHRDNLYNVRVRFDGPQYDDFLAAKSWIDEFVDVTRFMDKGETYQNFPEKNLKNYLHRYYGKNLNRLIRIKTKWDPYGYFRSEQSIPTLFQT
ncbi:Xylooligosaccharide oxidase [Pseudolycoriella hygida]|uniref:Xylooligosaccharide oxidase n=1 Tax=Pseudolycoriella hygida TaxID=35572 RepID=A0A9Q0S0A4_9DIPT|nr:Xylooligosaccharide oxidase [Pseudolycoriella hygida]